MGKKIGRPKIDPYISFLCNIATKSTKKDKAKLSQVLQYLKKIDDKSIMGEDSIVQLFTWADAEYGVNPDLKSHTSGCMYFGYGMSHCKSNKKKLNKKYPLGLN